VQSGRDDGEGDAEKTRVEMGDGDHRERSARRGNFTRGK
jgi:hypothetical protein